MEELTDAVNLEAPPLPVAIKEKVTMSSAQTSLLLLETL